MLLYCVVIYLFLPQYDNWALLKNLSKIRCGDVRSSSHDSTKTWDDDILKTLQTWRSVDGLPPQREGVSGTFYLPPDVTPRNRTCTSVDTECGRGPTRECARGTSHRPPDVTSRLLRWTSVDTPTPLSRTWAVPLKELQPPRVRNPFNPRHAPTLR